MVLGALAAAAASLALAWWLGVDDNRQLVRTGSPPAVSPSRPIPQRSYAGAPDAGQVGRAYDQVRDVYAESGAAGLVRFSRTCSESLRADPRVLDFCLAFDLYAGPVTASGAADAETRAWFADGSARRLAETRASLPPAADAAARLAAVQRLMRDASGIAEARSKPVRSAPAVRTATAKARHAARPAAVRRPAAIGGRAPPGARCQLRSTPADRTVCASPGLQASDRRMQAAYRAALASGANRGRLGRDQARWRVTLNRAAPNRAAVGALYESRIRELRAMARRR
ncbi:hypothetical protein DJ021_11385 [Phenylobacterium hankyongense]|uniref:Lysozyme inhibitor LprI N-terminal domain-containing protein n=1 Tax=Phenylobacterium hankyongense TaxID=1813876 RepID=A0A328B1B1_9CAUL|nr:hypothetical protein DJ021_11385 [Phenylobacterium hankyongense]